MILNLYKEVGETPLERINKFKKENPEYEDISLSYAGRLDPMAEGLLLVVVGDENKKNKIKYLSLDKEYEFEVLFGLETDTNDVLGVVDCDNDKRTLELTQEIIQELLKYFKGKQIQKYPRYSSKTINGIPLWRLEREGKLDEENIPEHNIEIYSLKYISTTHIASSDLLKIILEKISKVQGDFRQKESVDSWIKILEDDREFLVVRFRSKVSSGTYIRVLAYDIGKKLGVCAMTLSIKRTKIGNHSIK